jgi:hypothetical protein
VGREEKQRKYRRGKGITEATKRRAGKGYIRKRG